MTLTTAPALLWLRQDLRLSDHAALAAAMAGGRAVVCVYVLDAAGGGPWALGGAQRWWLHHSLADLGAALRRRGGELLLRRGDPRAVIPLLAAEAGAAEVHVTAMTEPWARSRDTDVAAALAGQGVRLHAHPGFTLFDPEPIRTAAGAVYGVFSAFARACRARPPPPLPACPVGPIATVPGLATEALDSWRLLPAAPDWAGGLRATWTPGEAAAAARLERFLATGLAGYDTARNRPDGDFTSMLSPYLHWGEIAPVRVWHRVHACAAAQAIPGSALESFTNELLWREFYSYQLWHMPDMPDQPLRPQFRAMPWRTDAAGLRAWQRGRTGVPLVDAGMRQLWHTGWMHNRVRMVAASYLTKHLLLDWRLGERWFWDTLVDADLGSNAGGWQWVAGSGSDSAPYFRVMNPALQGARFDPEGAYVRAWVPELAALPAPYVHVPWQAPEPVLRAAGVRLDESYPRPIVDLAEGRARALAAFHGLGGGAGERPPG